MKAWGMSHVGMARKLNEDSFLICMSADQKGGYFIVCDGMGGAKAGDVASRLATDTFASRFDPAVPSSTTRVSVRLRATTPWWERC